MSTNPLLESGDLPKFSQISPTHVEPAVLEVIESNRKQLDDLLESAELTELSFENGILPLENLQDRIRSAWAPVSHLHAVTNSPELRAAYNNCLSALSRYQTDLSQDIRLYRLYSAVAENLPAGHTPGAESALDLALRDFHLAGVALPAEQKLRFKNIMEELSGLHARFEQNVLDSMAAWKHHETVHDRLAGIPATTLEQAAANASEGAVEGWLFRLDQPTYVAITTHADNRELRELMYRAWSTRASENADNVGEFDNTDVMQQILALRHEAAQIVGYTNYAEYSLASKMASSVEEVQKFLEDLADRSRSTAADELRKLEKFAGQSLEAWDIAYFSEKLRMDQYAVSDEQLRPYFPVESVLTGLFSVIERLYGLTIEPVADVDTWHSDVRFYELRDADGNAIGGFYVDLFARPNKRSGAWMDDCISRKRINGKIQNPVAHLVCNFAGPTESSPSLLTHDDVVTLFHECGHTLHHLLTRMEIPSISGINGVPWDAVELPSQFMENFAWEPEVIKLISGHYRTREPLPAEVLERLQASRIFQAGLQMLRQLEFSLFDLRLHAEYDDNTEIMALLGAVRERVAVVRIPEFNRFPHAFSHIFGGGYAAGYYSYKWAEVLAADAWSAFAEHGIFDQETATRFRQTILEIGGTGKIADAFVAFRGREPDIQPLLAQSGITMSAEQ